MRRALRWKKVFFIIFKGLSVAKNCLRPESAPLNLFNFRSETKDNCLFWAFSIAACGDNTYVNDLRILRVIELYVNPWFYSQHPIFTLLLNNNPDDFNSIGIILAISVSHNALDTNKTKGELVQKEALNIFSANSWCGFLCALVLP